MINDKELVVIITPCYNEEECLGFFYNEFKQFQKQNMKYNVVWLAVNDGSVDNTCLHLKEFSSKDNTVHYLNLSVNSGHQQALRAGLTNVKRLKPSIVITMDADLQHPFRVVNEMVREWEISAADVIYTKRNNDNTSIIKSITSNLFYRIINYLGDGKIESGTADFRLLSRNVLNALSEFNEYDIFYRGIFPKLGFKQVSISYSPLSRVAGKTKYTFSKMIKFAITGITSFSTKPLYLSIWLGCLSSIFAFTYFLYALYAKIYLSITIDGWTSLILSVLFLGGVQLIVLGILGVYIGKIFVETKNRPKYIIWEKSF